CTAAAPFWPALAQVLEAHTPGSTQAWVATGVTYVRPVTPVDEDGAVRPHCAEVVDAGGVMTTLNTTASCKGEVIGPQKLRIDRLQRAAYQDSVRQEQQR